MEAWRSQLDTHTLSPSFSFSHCVVMKGYQSIRAI